MDSTHEFLDIVRRRLEHEDNLVNQRLAWLLTSQAFLLTAYAILLNAPVTLRSATHETQQALLLWLIPLSAIVTISLIWLAIVAALLAMRDLRASAAGQKISAVDDPGSAEMRDLVSAHIQGTKQTLVLGLAAPVIIPPVFLATWIILIVR